MPRQTLSWLPIHATDWLTSETITLLAPAGEAAYLRLLLHQWRSEDGTLPADEATLRALTRLSVAEWRKAWPILAKHFPLDPDGRRRNARLEAERGAVHATRQARSEAGSRGNARRWAIAGRSPGDRDAIAKNRNPNLNKNKNPNSSTEQGEVPLDASSAAQRAVSRARAPEAVAAIVGRISA